MHIFPDFIERLPAVDVPLPGVAGTILQGRDQQVVFLSFNEDIVVPQHRHRAQWELVLAGKVTLNLEGKVVTYQQGERFYVPEGALHGAVVKAGYRAIVFFDQPDRYLAR